MDFYLKIEDPDSLPDNCQLIVDTALTSGKTITHPVYLMGGGQIYKKYFLEAIGNNRYKNAYEWCAGHGEIGFELITNGICETLTFSDMHPHSAEWCLKNANKLNLSQVISAHTSSTISGLPNNIKWDLVVGNPPNSIDPDPVFLEKSVTEYGYTPGNLQLYARLTWDSEFRTHTEFFKNIGNYTTPDVDIFLTVSRNVIDYALPLTKSCGFKIVKVFDMFPDDPELKVVHYKKIS